LFKLAQDHLSSRAVGLLILYLRRTLRPRVCIPADGFIAGATENKSNTFILFNNNSYTGISLFFCTKKLQKKYSNKNNLNQPEYVPIGRAVVRAAIAEGESWPQVRSL
jgi:hypothetical protein